MVSDNGIEGMVINLDGLNDVKIDGEKIADMAYTLDFADSVILQAGKRKYAKLIK